MGASVIFPQYLPPVVHTGKSTAISEIGIVGDVVVGAALQPRRFSFVYMNLLARIQNLHF
jgi:hypothetical protein